MSEKILTHELFLFGKMRNSIECKFSICYNFDKGV